MDSHPGGDSDSGAPRQSDAHSTAPKASSRERQAHDFGNTRSIGYYSAPWHPRRQLKPATPCDRNATGWVNKRKTIALGLWLLDSALEILVLPDAFEYHDTPIAKKPTLSTRKGILGLEAQTVILFDANLAP